MDNLSRFARCQKIVESKTWCPTSLWSKTAWSNCRPRATCGPRI